MATLLSHADGNLTGSGTWSPVSAAALLDSEAGSTALSTSNLDSSTFVLEANQIDGFAIKLASRVAGSPSNTLTVKLRNSTTATDIWSMTINVSDLDPCDTTDHNGGWYFFSFTGSPHTPNGTDSYVIRLVLSATTTAVNFWTNGTANNWSRIVRRTTTTAPSAGDNMHIVAEWTAAATKTNRTVTQDSTATTDYGAASTSVNTPALSINKGGTLASGTTASTAYNLRVSGWVIVYSGGTLTLGTTGTPVPITSTSTLELDSAADGDFGLKCASGGTLTGQGVARTSGKNVVWTLLTVDASSAATSLTVADDTGWLNGDDVGIADTAQTLANSEQKTLNANATSTGLSLSAGLGAAHKGTTSTKTQAEVVLLTRNVKIKGTNASFGWRFRVSPVASIDFDWVEMQYLDSSDGLVISSSAVFTGTATFSYCCERDARGYAIDMIGTGGGAGGTLLFEHHIIYNCGVAGSVTGISCTGTTTGGSITFNDIVMVKNAAFVRTSFNFTDTGVAFWTIGSMRIGSTAGVGINLAPSTVNWKGKSIGPFVIHSGTSSDGFTMAGTNQSNLNIAGITSWRNASNGVDFTGSMLAYIEIDSILAFGNTNNNIQMNSKVVVGMLIHNLQAYGDTSFATTQGIILNPTDGFQEIRIEKADFGTASGNWTTHTNDVIFAGSGSIERLIINNGLLASATKINALSSVPLKRSTVQLQRYQRTAGSHQTQTPVGNLAIETSTVDVTPSLKMTPADAALKLRSNAHQFGYGFLVPVASGDTPTVSVKVQKDASYNGNAARLVLLQNSALGQDSDSVIATHSAASGSWQTLSGALPAATDDGVWELVVDCDGTAGNIFVDTGAVS